MPTYERTPEFLGDLRRLTPAQRQLFETAVKAMVEDLRAVRPFRSSLRIERFHRRPGAYEMTWAPDGRALFTYGPSIRLNEPHIVWLAVGTHRIYTR